MALYFGLNGEIMLIKNILKIVSITILLGLSTSGAQSYNNLSGRLYRLAEELRYTEPYLSPREQQNLSQRILELENIVFRNADVPPCQNLVGKVNGQDSVGYPIHNNKEDASGIGNYITTLSNGTSIKFLGGTHRNITHNSAGAFAVSVEVMSSSNVGKLGWMRLEYTDFAIRCPDLERYLQNKFPF